MSILALAGLLTACAAQLDPARDAASLALFDQARRHAFAAIEAHWPPARRNAVADARLQAQAALIPDRPPEAVRRVGFTSETHAGGRLTGVTREYLYPDRLLVVSSVIRDAPGQPDQIISFEVRAWPRAALAVGQFDLTGKSTMQYFGLGLAAAIPLLLVIALFILARDRRARWKWLWTPFIMIGLMRLSIDWSTGAMLFTPLALVPLGASVTRGPIAVSPWVVSISLPLGALIYLARLWYRARPDETDETGDTVG